MPTKSQTWFVYIARCKDHSLYTGITTDLERRLFEHNHCDKKSAKYTRFRRPVSFVYSEQCNNRSIASQRERQIKSLSKKQKELLVKE